MFSNKGPAGSAGSMKNNSSLTSCSCLSGKYHITQKSTWKGLLAFILECIASWLTTFNRDVLVFLLEQSDITGRLLEPINTKSNIKTTLTLFLFLGQRLDEHVNYSLLQTLNFVPTIKEGYNLLVWQMPCFQLKFCNYWVFLCSSSRTYVMFNPICLNFFFS